MNPIFLSCLFLSILLAFPAVAASTQTAKHDTVQVDGHALHIARWGESQQNLPTVILLSGPIDTWHSDTAWFAALAPRLASSHEVLAIDRAGLVLGTPDAPVGYQHFAHDLNLLLPQLGIKRAIFVAFASSNISLQLLANSQAASVIEKAIMIDPDVLTPFSTARYKSDAKPFKDNLDAYVTFIQDGKYSPRVEQKNASDLAQLMALQSLDSDTDWDYVKFLFAARLAISNQVNLFREIAIYGQDLDAVAATTWPATIVLRIVDTDFEDVYITQTPAGDEQLSLIQWQQDASDYYQQVIEATADGRYIHATQQSHLYQFAEVNAVLDLIRQ
jgi:pimeloyl-ACP methyl ester carboxylesterase